MIVGLGVDLVDIRRIEKVYQRHGLRFINKFLTGREIALLPQQPAKYLASRFAAKEAASKALGTGFSGNVDPHGIEITNSASGKPKLDFSGGALIAATGLGATSWHISISHEREYALAMVILES